MKQSALAARADISVRDLQDVLKRLTEQYGRPVCSSCRKPMGVFIPETESEVDEYVGQLRARATSAFRRIAALSRAAAAELVREQQQEIAFPVPQYTRVRCACGCGQEFEPAKSTQIYINEQHRYRAANERRSA